MTGNSYNSSLQKPLAFIRAQFFDKEFFSILKLYNGLLPFWYIAVPPAKRMHVFMQCSAGLYVEVSARHVAGAEDMDSSYNAFVVGVIV